MTESSAMTNPGTIERPRTMLTPEQYERAKAVGMGVERPLVHDIERAIRYARIHRLFTAESVEERRENSKLKLAVEADLSAFVAECAYLRWWKEGD
jgi:hypothetical protein